MSFEYVLKTDKRDREDIAAEFLVLLRGDGLFGCNATKILRRVNISSAIFKDLKERFVRLDLISVHEGRNTTYTITDKGLEFLRFYENFYVIIKEIKRKK